MPGVRGKTNNPNGRPPKSRALTDLLTKALSKKVDLPDGTTRLGKQILANLMADAVITGRVTFPGDNESSVISIKDWIEFAKWVYTYLEPPITKHELTGSEGGAIVIDWSMNADE